MKQFLMVGAAMMLACSVGLAREYRIGDEVPFVDGQPMPYAPSGTAWCLVRKPAVYETRPGPATTIQVPVPAQFATREEEHLAIPEHRTLTAVQAQFQQRAHTYVAVEAHKKLEIVPAVWRDEQVPVEVCPAYDEIRVIPAQFRDVPKPVTISPPKKSFTQVACADATLCWAVSETQARTRNITVRELVADARYERVTVPPQTRMVTVRRLVTPETVREVQVEARQAQIQVNAVAAQAQVREERIPAQNQRITVEIEVTPQTFTTQTLTGRPERIRVKEEEVVWRLQAANAPMPTPVSHVQSGSEYGSVPGFGQDIARPMAPRR
jgi:hypothetical protein